MQVDRCLFSIDKRYGRATEIVMVQDHYQPSALKYQHNVGMDLSVRRMNNCPGVLGMLYLTKE